MKYFQRIAIKYKFDIEEAHNWFQERKYSYFRVILFAININIFNKHKRKKITIELGCFKIGELEEEVLKIMKKHDRFHRKDMMFLFDDPEGGRFCFDWKKILPGQLGIEINPISCEEADEINNNIYYKGEPVQIQYNLNSKSAYFRRSLRRKRRNDLALKKIKDEQV